MKQKGDLYLLNREKFMKNGKFAIYKGREYISGKNKDGKLVLRSTDIRDIENGFEQCEPFMYKNCEKEIVCLKFVNRSDVEDYYSLKTKAIYAGYEFEVFEEKDDKLSIVAMTGDYKDWLGLGMECIEKGVYPKWINIDEAKLKIIKEQL